MRDINLIAISHLVCFRTLSTSVCVRLKRVFVCGARKSYKNPIYKMFTLISFLIYEYVWLTLG